MPFEIQGKIALISGGASGIGLKYAKQLLKNGLRGVTLADINNDFGHQALEEIEKEFGPNKAIYVQTDVSDISSYEGAFQKTIKEFKNIDIVINNAGILNDAIWEREIDINVKGVIHGIILGLENYIQKYRTGTEGVILNMSSVAGLMGFNMMPIYSGTKFAVMGMSKGFGDELHYKETKIKVLALCPGATETPLLFEMPGRNLGPRYERILETELQGFPPQTPDHVAQAMVKIIQNAPTGTVWVVEDGKEAYEYILPPRESFAPK